MSGREVPHLQLGWDIGGAHVKACLLEDGALRDVAQWPCPLWQGMQHLDAALDQARSRWSDAWGAGLLHAATMTGELADVFPDRGDGVARITDRPAQVLAPRVGDAVLVDIGSTTTDLVALRDGRVAAQADSDTERLATGELVYQGVVRTPLCALGPRVRWRGRTVNVMNEFFATTADVHRLTGELDPAHDQAATADGRGKDAGATRQRLARMLGCDAGDASESEWLALARWWKDAQLREIRWHLDRVCASAGLPGDAPVVAAGCGTFLAAQLAQDAGRLFLRYADVALQSPVADAGLAAWADVCAPAVSVALLACGRG